MLYPLAKFQLKRENGAKHRESTLKIFYRNQLVMIPKDEPFPSGLSEFIFGDWLYRLRHLDRRYLHAHYVMDNGSGETVKVFPVPITLLFRVGSLAKTRLELLDQICQSLFDLTSHRKYYDAMRYQHDEEGVIFIKINANGQLWKHKSGPFSFDGYGKSIFYTAGLGYVEAANTFRMSIENRETLSPSQTSLEEIGYFWFIIIENTGRTEISSLRISSCSWHRSSSAKFDAWLFLKKLVEPWVFTARISIRIMRETTCLWARAPDRQRRKLYYGMLICEASLYSAVHSKIFDKDTRVDRKLPGYPEFGTISISGIV